MFYIYHIPGVKIGVTVDVERRTKNQKATDYEILEEHTDIYEVSTRELELQEKYGYPVDSLPYYESSKLHSKRTQETIEKIRKHNIGSKRTLEVKEKLSKAALKRFSQSPAPSYGSGVLYKDLLSGFVGYRIDIRKRFPGISVNQSLNKEVTRKDGTVVHIVILDQPGQ